MYITDSTCISPQRTFDHSFLDGDVQRNQGVRYSAIEPNYGQLIPAGLLRRMGKAVRMGVGAGLPLIQKTPVDGIILGTANGGLEDCLRFLNQIVDYKEGTLTPTNFVQSTPNAIAGNLALMSKTTGYNITHVHKGLAFEAALLDALLLLQENQLKTLLVGSVEEISDYNHNIDSLAGAFKTEDISSEELLSSDSPGSVNGEGSAMFVMESGRTDRTIARVVDVFQSSYLPESELEGAIFAFLERNGLTARDIDTLFLGVSGDNRTDHIYKNLNVNFFTDSNCYWFKHLAGDHPTASSFAFWLAVQLLAGKSIPDVCIYRHAQDRQPKNILIYNHFKGTQHGFILLGK
ncbi:beta-ketoacyl synthase chain length factor [Dyadobacter sp. CY323]|uniref:beta-ketoacyl synthase chain length factor n=1 Tax=Dyadobacter sp. CY323 TaxID=2907302 RepID=UPI001F3541A9|nr:beta-ketoacyl synthase chain length factor [Dyadobacter sp. CY323]MCE6991348.1 beta-ketoacyl synthase chain length factor [Dyadobacter sp. CY323]